MGKILSIIKYYFVRNRGEENENNSQNVQKIGKNLYEVEYKIKGKQYKMMVSPKRGPPKIVSIFDKDGNDITDCIMPYLGPNYDWSHHRLPHPHLVHERCIHVEKYNGEKETIYFSSFK